MVGRAGLVEHGSRLLSGSKPTNVARVKKKRAGPKTRPFMMRGTEKA
jgi:hypothetical protein